MNQLTQIVSTPAGTFAVLALAAYLEVQGDACFQAGLYHASGMRRLSWFLAGATVLVCNSLFLNSSKVNWKTLAMLDLERGFLRGWKGFDRVSLLIRETQEK